MILEGSENRRKWREKAEGKGEEGRTRANLINKIVKSEFMHLFHIVTVHSQKHLQPKAD